MNEGTTKRLGNELSKLLTDTATAAGVELKASAGELGDYIAERLSHLTVAATQPGFDEAVQAERDNVRLFAADKAVDEGDSVDARLLGILEGGLRMAVSAVK